MYIFINEMVLIDNERNKINRAPIMDDKGTGCIIHSLAWHLHNTPWGVLLALQHRDSERENPLMMTTQLWGGRAGITALIFQDATPNFFAGHHSWSFCVFIVYKLGPSKFSIKLIILLPLLHRLHKIPEYTKNHFRQVPSFSSTEKLWELSNAEMWGNESIKWQ